MLDGQKNNWFGQFKISGWTASNWNAQDNVEIKSADFYYLIIDICGWEKIIEPVVSKTTLGGNLYGIDGVEIKLIPYNATYYI